MDKRFHFHPAQFGYLMSLEAQKSVCSAIGLCFISRKGKDLLGICFIQNKRIFNSILYSKGELKSTYLRSQPKALKL